MGVAIITLLLIISIASIFTQIFKIRQESSIGITMISICLLLYVFGLFNKMEFALHLIYILAIIGLVFTNYGFIKKKIKFEDIFSLGTLMYILVILIVSIFLKNTKYLEWDEFSHWGANLKAMVQYNLFWSNKIYDGVHVVYTPLVGLAEYFICKINGGFAEDVSYLGISIFLFSIILPICKKEKDDFKSLVKLTLFWLIAYTSIVLCNFKLSSIYIDLVLGIIFGMAMFISFRLEEKDDKIYLMLLLIALPLVKETGLLFLGIVLINLFFKEILFNIIENKKITKDNFKKFGILILILIISIFMYFSWKIYCKSNDRVLDDRHDKNSITSININQYLKSIILLKNDQTKYYDIAKKFYETINTETVIGSDNSTNLSVIKLMVILNILGILVYFSEKDEKNKNKLLSILASFDIGFALYSLLLLATFMFAFTETEGRILASYSRYMSTYFIAWILAFEGIVINQDEKNKIIKLFITLLICIYPINFILLVDNTSRKNNSGLYPEVLEKSQIINNNVNLNDKVYIIYQNIGGGYEFHQLRYCISPIVTNLMYEWSLGPKNFEADIWNYDITKEEFEQKLINEKFKYIFIAKIDEQFMKIYGDLISGYDINNYEELNNKLLKITQIDENNVVLNVCEIDE